ncbi:MAG: hypothetical protein ACUVS6_02650 [Anaerolineae bacterium]
MWPGGTAARPARIAMAAVSGLLLGQAAIYANPAGLEPSHLNLQLPGAYGRL